MRDKLKPTPVFDPAVLPQLACPACQGGLSLEGMRLVCDGCRRSYPVVDGIPVLIVEHGRDADVV